MATLTIARFTLLELWRRRLVLAVAVLAALLVALTTWTFAYLPGVTIRLSAFFGGVETTRPLASQVLILLMFLWSALFAATAAVIAAFAISSSVESGEILGLLARPVSRVEFVLGRWSGLAVFVVVFAAVGSGAEILAAFLTTGHVPADTLQTLLFVAMEGLVILTFALALSTHLPGIAAGVVAVVSFGFAWIGGVMGGLGVWTENPPLTEVSTITKLVLPSDALWRAALFHLERPGGLFSGVRSVTMAANPFFDSEASTSLYLVWSIGWIVGVLGLAAWSFREREI